MISALTLLAGALFSGVGGPVTGLSILPASQRTEVVIAVQGQVDYRHFTMEGPNRLIIDLLGARHALPQENFLGINRGGVIAVRTSQYSDDAVRIVVELDELVPYEVSVSDGEVIIALENSAGGFTPWTSTLESGSVANLQPAPRRGVDVRAPSHAEVGRNVGFLRQQAGIARITISFSNTPIRDVLFTFAEFADRSIVPGSDVAGLVSADIRRQPWDEALRTILEARGLVAREMDSGIIRVDNLENLSQRETVEPVVTRAFRIGFATASELQLAVTALLSERGRISSADGTNTLIVTDVPRVLNAVEALITELDVRIPQVNIAAKIVFVNRTDLSEFGVTYDLKDSAGNQLNQLTSGIGDPLSTGELAAVEGDRVSLGGNSIAALGNANARVINPSLTILSSLLVGRHTLVNFIEALESTNLSTIEARPSLQVLDNQLGRILVGERTPLRVLDDTATGGAGGAVTTATVTLQETGIVLEVTPHVTGNLILLELRVERSSAELGESDVGFIFRTQEGITRVLLEDGETAVIAGLTVTENTEVRTGIPLLRDIPIIGALFRTTQTQTIQRDLMMLVTPTIVRARN